jgi:uncharacterized membrane protein YbhN (UPF0104 family)
VLKGMGMARTLRVVFLLATAIGIGYALYRLWPDVSAALASVSWGALVLSLLLAFGFQLTGMFAWRTTLGELGSPVRPGSAAHIYFVSQLGKYVPGSIWAAVAMLRLGQEADIPRARMGYSYLLSMAFSLLTGLAIGVPALIAYGGDYLPLALGTLAVLAVLLLWPRLLNAVLDKGLRLARRGRLEQPLSGAGIARIVLLYLLAWSLGGLHVWVLSVAMGADGLHSPFPSIAAFSVASALGVLVVLAPAGAGVRDVLMVLILTPVIGTGAATAVAVISRGALTVLDAASAGVAELGHRWGLRRAPHRGAPPPGTQPLRLP